MVSRRRCVAIEVRIRFGNGARKRFDVATETRATALRDMARTLAKAKVDQARAESILTDAAVASEREFTALAGLAGELAGGKSVVKPMKAKGPTSATFRSLGEQWVSGELHRKWPDHVKIKRSAATDEGRLDALYKTIGDVQLVEFTLADAERAMAALPETVRSSASRRQYAQLISKVLKLAVYPCKLIDAARFPSASFPRSETRRSRPTSIRMRTRRF